MALVEGELTGIIKCAAFDVHNDLGFGLPEDAYQRGMELALKNVGLVVTPKRRVVISHGGVEVVELFPDLIVEDRVVVELKAIREEFAQAHFVQLFTYLKAGGIRVGKLINFGRERVADERLVFDEKPTVVKEDWSEVKDKVVGETRNTLQGIRQALLEVGERHGLGYGDATYRRIVEVAMAQRKLAFAANPLAKIALQGQPLGDFSLDCFLVPSQAICSIHALKDGLSNFDLARARSFARNLGVTFGVIANFGKAELDIRGVAT